MHPQKDNAMTAAFGRNILAYVKTKNDFPVAESAHILIFALGDSPDL